MQESNIIGIDLGGTNVRVASITDLKIKKINSRKINSQGSVEDVLKEIYSIIDTVIDSHSKAIGIGLPGLVNEDKGIVYDVINIPSWKEVSVRSLVEEKYQIVSSSYIHEMYLLMINRSKKNGVVTHSLIKLFLSFCCHRNYPCERKFIFVYI